MESGIESVGQGPDNIQLCITDLPEADVQVSPARAMSSRHREHWFV